MLVNNLVGPTFFTHATNHVGPTLFTHITNHVGPTLFTRATTQWDLHTLPMQLLSASDLLNGYLLHGHTVATSILDATSRILSSCNGIFWGLLHG